ncbi:MAG: hypothetical protein WCV63_04530 [Negativicutes bacterium]
MKTGIFLTARLGSSRLKRKHLLEIQKKPIILYLIDRIQLAFKQEIADRKLEIVITTSDELENREFEGNVNSGVKIFYGSLNNIPLRHLQAAKKNDCDYIIAVDGDDILCSTDGMRAVYQELILGKAYVRTSGLPFGMNVMGYSTEFLVKALRKNTCKILETGWGRIFNGDEASTITFSVNGASDDMRFTLDYLEDFNFFSELFQMLANNSELSTDQEIVDCVRNNRLHEITANVSSTYWINFNREKEREEQHEF